MMDAATSPNWASLPFIATVARLLCRELTPCCPSIHP